MNVLVTGGAGFIGTHTVLALQRQGYRVAVIDNFANSSLLALRQVERLSGQPVMVFRGDATKSSQIETILHQWPAEAIIHFAGLKAVGESAKKPLEYYRNNVLSTIAVGQAAIKKGVKHIVFSSTATVYGQPKNSPVPETAPLQPESPYARSKCMSEQVLADLHTTHPDISVVVLRYFNPIGADESGEIGEDPRGVPYNLLPFISQLAVGKHKKLKIYGADYPTRDGTAIRDYVHVSDVAAGHVVALEKAPRGISMYNLGTGTGKSVLEVLHAFEAVCNKKMPYEFAPRRTGDVPEVYADPRKMKRELGWHASRTLQDMCRDIWRWQSRYPQGFAGLGPSRPAPTTQARSDHRPSRVKRS